MGPALLPDNLGRLRKTEAVKVEMIADLDTNRAAQRSQEFSVPSSGSVDELLARNDIDLIVNLTIPIAHEEVTIRALQAGKHVFSEKPLALNTESVGRILKQARESNREVGCAPDTFLGPGIQTGLRLIRDGRIGQPFGATTAFEVSGPESWHPNPDFLYAKGGGPIFDMGPYYLTAMVCAFGSIRQVAARSTKARATRVIGSGPRAGQEFPVEVPTNVFALLDFADGQIAQSSFSFDSARMRAGILEVHGTEGSLVFPDPNGFEGNLQLWKLNSSEPEEVPCEGKVMYRGVGVVDMVRAIKAGRKPRASIELAGHIVEVMQSLEKAAAGSEPIAVESRVTTPELVAIDFNPWLKGE